MAFLGFVTLESDLKLTFLVRSGDTPSNSTSLPTVRIYGPAGLMTNGTGSGSFKDTGTITDATNASPIVVTDADHGLTTGTRVTITGVLGNTAANGTFVVTYVSSSTFSLDSSTGNGAYTSGGTWNTTGLYTFTVSATAANGYATGVTYHALASFAISGTNYALHHTFVVV